MKVIHVLTAAVIALMCVPASAASLNTQDSEFLTTAMQIQAGRYALASYAQQHGSGKVKAFAASIVTQGTADSRMLTGLAKRYGVTPTSKLLIQDQYHYGQLQGLSGSALDKSFVRELRISDQINVDTYKEQTRKGSDATLKTYAKQRYAALQHEITALKKM